MKISLAARWDKIAAFSNRAFLLAALLLSSVAALPASAQVLEAGVAQVDITPPPGLPMYGYFDRLTKHQLATGTLDPLYARVLVLLTGNTRVALVTLDLGRTFNKNWLDRLRDTAKQTSHINELIVAASHTHSGPNIRDKYPADRPDAWENTTLDKVAGAIRQAALQLEPVRLGSGSGVVHIGYNRRKISPDGSVTMLWSNPNKIPTTPVDGTVAVIRIDRQDGTPIAVLVGYACHPVVFGTDNLQYSADYVGTMIKTVADAFSAKPICLFLQGGDGDINPYYATTAVDQGAMEKRDWTGRELGREAVRIAKAIRTQAYPGGLDFADDEIMFPLRWNPQVLHDGLLRVNGPQVFEDHAEPIDASPPPSKLSLRVTTLLIDKRIGIVGMPGEPFVDFQIDLRSRCPVAVCLLSGYTNGYFDYFPTILAASQGGYGAGDSNTYVAIGAGEHMLDHAIIRMYEMLGELRAVPEVGNETPQKR